MMNFLQQLLIALSHAELWQATLRSATPLLLAALGGVLSERSGVINIALEGMMLTGAFFAVVATLTFQSPLIAVLIAMMAGACMAYIHAIASVKLHADQIVSGIAINIFALGLTGYLLRSIYGQAGPPDMLPYERIPDIVIPGLSQIPFIGPILGEQNLITYVALLVLVSVHFLLFKTTFGLRLRSVGEYPRAADTAGINVQRMRYLAVTASGVLAGLAGAYLSIGFIGSFTENMTSGRGFIALAAMIFGKWTPLGAFAACLIFGFGDALGNQLQQTSGVPAQFLLMLPYILTIIALAGLVGRSTPPAADGVPYEVGAD
jgi:ABC-type uncharacterized transport system permease subunit